MKSKPLSILEPEFELTEEDFKEIESILKKRVGIQLADGAHRLVIARLSKNLKRSGTKNFNEYLNLVKSDEGKAEKNLMINALTTNTTHFFREKGHFELLETHFMKRLIFKAKGGKRVRLWSAACSSGQEAYSIAASVVRLFPDVHNYDFRILATDINTDMLDGAKLGLYDFNCLKDLSDAYKGLIFEPELDGCLYKVRKNLQDLISFRYMNFMDTWPVSGPFDVIFCRNVAIYMDPDTQMKIWTGLERVLDEEGGLFIGHSERIGSSLSHRLELFGPNAFCRPGHNPINSKFPMEQ